MRRIMTVSCHLARDPSDPSAAAEFKRDHGLCFLEFASAYIRGKTQDTAELWRLNHKWRYIITEQSKFYLKCAVVKRDSELKAGTSAAML